jgi:cytoskeletal protein CcmA (bactofilin family)/hemoglobin-like flavoprotein
MGKKRAREPDVRTVRSKGALVSLSTTWHADGEHWEEMLPEWVQKSCEVTPRTVKLLHWSWAAILSGTGRLARYKEENRQATALTFFYDTFFDKLYSIAPGARAAFSDGAMTVQSRALFAMMGYFTKILDSWQGSPETKELTERHIAYGALPEHLGAMASALLYALETCGGSAVWTAAVSAAWMDTLSFICVIMTPRFYNHVYAAGTPPPPRRGSSSSGIINVEESSTFRSSTPRKMPSPRVFWSRMRSNKDASKGDNTWCTSPPSARHHPSSIISSPDSDASGYVTPSGPRSPLMRSSPLPPENSNHAVPLSECPPPPPPSAMAPSPSDYAKITRAASVMPVESDRARKDVPELERTKSLGSPPIRGPPGSPQLMPQEPQSARAKGKGSNGKGKGWLGRNLGRLSTPRLKQPTEVSLFTDCTRLDAEEIVSPSPASSSQPRVLCCEPDAGLLPGTDVEGTVRFRHFLRIDGKLRGAMKCGDPKGGLLHIGPGGVLIATVVGFKEVMVEGRLEGDVDAESIFLKHSAHIVGDLHASNVQIETGVTLEGAVHIKTPRKAMDQSDPWRYGG